MTFPGSQTGQQVETHPGSEYTKQISEVREINNGHTRKHKDILADRQMGNIRGFQGRLLSNSNIHIDQEIPVFFTSRVNPTSSKLYPLACLLLQWNSQQ